MKIKVKFTRYSFRVTIPYKNGSVTYERWLQEQTNFSTGWKLDRKSNPKFSDAKINRMMLSRLDGAKMKELVKKARYAQHYNSVFVSYLDEK